MPKPRSPSSHDTSRYSGQFTARLEEVVIAKEIDPQRLAQELGVSIPTVYKWLNGSRTPEYDRLPGIARALKCSISHLFPKPK